MAKKLAIKKYLSYKIDVLESQIRILDSQEKYLTQKERKLINLLNDEAYKELLDDYLAHYSLEASAWMNADYPKNQKYPEALVHPTVGGLYVRSKSESLIALALSEQKIPFRYENIITLGNVEVAPDFTILHPISGEVYYWEHFGLIDNDAYCEEFVFKIKAYADAGIILGKNLIVTFETKDNPLTYQAITRTINNYFFE